MRGDAHGYRVGVKEAYGPFLTLAVLKVGRLPFPSVKGVLATLTHVGVDLLATIAANNLGVGALAEPFGPAPDPDTTKLLITRVVGYLGEAPLVSQVT